MCSGAAAALLVVRRLVLPSMAITCSCRSAAYRRLLVQPVTRLLGTAPVLKPLEHFHQVRQLSRLYRLPKKVERDTENVFNGLGPGAQESGGYVHCVAAGALRA
jgi:hypothetical protein